MSDEGLPAVPIEEHDLRYFSHVEIDPRLVQGPAFADLPDEAVRGQLMLVLAAWREVPAGSLPVQETTLALLAGYGRDLHAWAAVRDAILRHWTYCADGRLYLEAMLPNVRAAAGRLKSKRVGDAQRKARSRTLKALRDVGVTLPEEQLRDRLDDVMARVAARGGNAPGRKADATRAVASEMGLLPREGGDLGPRFGSGFERVRAPRVISDTG